MRAFLNNSISRAESMTPANMGSFKVHAHSATNPGFDFTDVFTNNAGGSGYWNSANKHYWPGDDSELQFFAYAPATTAAAADGKTIPNYTISSTAQDQTDLVVGYNKGKKSTNEGPGLTMNFRHALSQVVIQAKNSNTTNMKVEVIGVKVGHIFCKGTLTMPTAETANNTMLLSPGDWTGHASALNCTAGSIDANQAVGNGILLNDVAQSLQFNGGSFMLLPQMQQQWDGTQNTNGAYLSVLCRISQNDGAGNWNLLYPKPNTSNYAYSAVPVAVNWEPGKKYIYTLDFFGNGGGGQVDPEDPNGDGGNNIVGGPIKFTVTVDNWTDAGNTEINM